MALSNLTKVQTLGIGSNIEVVGVITTGQFKSGTSNLHSTGVELTNLNVSGIATIGGSISIGGTLTYQDVTNVDSVGLITARAGINITGGNITLGDSSGSSDDRILLGASNDCHIHHNGTDTFISNDTGDLVLNNIGGNSDDIFIRSKDDITLQVQSSENAIVCKGDDAVELYYNNTKTLSTFVNALHLFGNQYECNIDFKIDNGNRVGFIGVTNSGRVQINGAAGGNPYETYFEGNLNGSSKLFFNNSSKLETTNTGAVVTGIMTATSFSGSGASLTNLNASNIASGTVPTARLGSGTANSSTFLAGDSTFKTVTGTTINNNANNRVITGSGTANTLEGEAALTFDGTNFNFSRQDAGDARMYIYGGEGGDARLLLASDEGDDHIDTWEMRAQASDNNLSIYQFGGGSYNKRLSIDTDANNGDVKVHTGNLVIGTAGKGIDFSADGSGTLKTLPNSFNAELLHDYENGTFTPNIQYDTGTNRYAGGNVSSAVGEYIRIGDLVNFGMKITLTGNRNYSENTHIYIGGLPYNGMHSSFQNSMQNGWGGWACPTNDNNFSYDVRYCFHGYTTVNLGFSQSSGNGGISGFYVWGFYRCAP